MCQNVWANELRSQSKIHLVAQVRLVFYIYYPILGDMKKVKKFDSFDELKSSEKNTMDQALRLRRHFDFEKVIKEIMSLKFKKNNRNPVKE
ncbi:MAG TPA: hypothetical protein DIW47_07940 [Bacteroidetes bacterium]|nr:hypothetical protein [Bacteroidota bacterium]